MNAIQPEEPLTIWGKGNAFLDNLSDGFSENVLVPGMVKTYKLVGEANAVSAGYVSSSLEGRIRDFWSAPISTPLAHKITVPFEKLTLRIGKRSPLNAPILRYLDACLISSAQSLHRFTKEVNYMLMIPTTLQRIVRGISPGETLDGIILRFCRKWSVFRVVMLRSKQFGLALLSMILKVIDSALKFLFLEGQFGILSYIQQVIQITREKAHSRFVETADLVIESQEKEIRKNLTANIAEGTTCWITTTVNRIALKTGLGTLAYHIGKTYLHQTHQIPPLLIHAIALPIIGKLLWDNAFVPILDPFFDSYDPAYKGKGSNLKNFLEYYDIGTFYLPLKASRGIMYLAKS